MNIQVDNANVRVEPRNKINASQQRYTRQRRTVRMLVNQVAWLGWQQHWQAGRVVWRTEQRGDFVPTAGDLALAQLRLVQVGRYAEVARRVVGDLHAWQAQRSAELALALLLHPLAAPDLPDLAARAPTADPETIQRLVALLPAEALCVNRLPASPAAALVACKQSAHVPLQRLVYNAVLPLPVRLLTAVTLGALQRATGYATLVGIAGEADAPLLWQAYAWGKQHGLPDDPWLAVQFLAAPDGATHLQRYQQARLVTRRCWPTDEFIHALLISGVTPAHLVTLLEALMAADRLGRYILVGKVRVTRKRRQKKGQKSGIVQLVEFPFAERQQAVTDLAGLLHSYVQSTTDPAVIDLIRHFIHAMFDLSHLSPELVKHTLMVLRNGLELPVHLQRAYLEILVTRHEQIWDYTDFPTDQAPDKLPAWLGTRWFTLGVPVFNLLRNAKDAAVVYAALDANLAPHIRYELPDPAMYPLLLTLVQQFGVDQQPRVIPLLQNGLYHFDNASTARGVLQPLLTAVLTAPLASQMDLLKEVISHVQRYRSGQLTQILPRLVFYVARLARSAQFSAAYWAELMEGLLLLERAVPDRAQAWFERVLELLSSYQQTHGSVTIDTNAIEIGLRLGVALAEGDGDCFALIFQAAISHSFEQVLQDTRQGIGLLARFPGLRPPLRQLFPQQPQRCTDLLVRVGRAECLGLAALDPLHDLVADPAAFLAHHALAPDWQIVLEHAPDMLLLAGMYLYSRHLLGASLGLPAGVRKALEQPRKLLAEAQHLEQRVAMQPERADLAARLSNLRTRLADPQPLWQAARQEARERLTQVTAEAQLLAAEQQLLVCYRERLEVVAGRVPADLPLDDDLLNAVLLSVDIRTNRRLLRKLLRAHLAGDTAWREQHPANVAFLTRLAAQGVDVATWLSAFPRTYPCKGVRGGLVHLTLERDPVRILQMGNYFDTCLSMGGCNSFSTVANACELNKRVLYARDEAGRVVGRKLIAINAAGRLVGFHTYTVVTDRQSNTRLYASIRHYLGLFAAQAGLHLGETGPVPLLFAEDWYDDGIVAWEVDQMTSAGKECGKIA